MLYLQFYVDDARYLLAAREVMEVVPTLKLHPLPHVPSYVVGLMSYRGTPVPVVDLCQLLLNRPCNQRLSSRIIVAKVHRNNIERAIGLVVEKATEAKKIEATEFFDPGIENPDTPYQDGVARDREGLMQRISAQALFSEPEFDLLFSYKEEARLKSAS